MPRQKVLPQPEPTDSPIAEYISLAENARWRVDQWELLAAEIPELKRSELPEFHQLVRRTLSNRSWLIVRRLFGFCPLDVPLDANPEDYRSLNRKEMAELLGINEKDVTSEIEVIRLAWRRNRRELEIATEASKPNIPATRSDKERIFTVDENNELLIRFSINPEIFDLNRTKQANELEKAWFCKRLREWEPLFTKSTMTEQLAKDTLNNELRLRREQETLWQIDRDFGTSSAKKKPTLNRLKNQIADRIKELQNVHAAQLDAITEHAPWFNVAEAQISATGAIAQLIQGFQEWEARKDSRIIDGVFTSSELQVLMRTSKQMDEPRYRWGWVMFVNESKRWLWDPSAKSFMREADLARFDNGFKEGVKKYNEANECPIVDLESDGPEGQYPDLKLMPDNKAA